ncbi:rho GTPase-activating protein 12a isoform X2 [Electrophorus electricus]|uniref:rho GTPase-activating protein 12a isoform X2 n=1 Tax=Electrophorus electricus TaxID=8005 RepID=UPI0015D0CBE2|nr:rho GTPase-activating protein 12a isoform X2 [Electrophorus electricus]
MADRCDLAPGQRYIEVDYDYDYKFKDRMISIKQGECYLLVKKTNTDWWQVRRDEGSKAFYVPAQYVREVRRALMPPPKPLLHASGAVGTRGGSKKNHPTVLDLKQSDESLNKRTPAPSSSGGQQVALQPPRDDRGSPKSPRRPTMHGSLPRNRAESPLGIRVLLDLDEECNREGERVGNGETKEEEVQDKSTAPREDSESGEELSSSSTEQLQGRPDSPVHTSLQQLKLSPSGLPPLPSGPALSTNGDWETHRDTSGRHFYYNVSTQERTWKPPRARDSRKWARHDSSPTTDTEPLSSEEYYLSSQSDSQYGSPPRGWSEELDEYGHTLYVCDYTNEKWIKHTDEQGRPYYYSADGSRSEWELPKVDPRTQGSGETHKTCSLDRKHPAPIMNKWRHSAYLLEANEIFKQRSVKNRRIFSLRKGCSRLHPYRSQEPLKAGTPDSDNCDPSFPKHPHSPSEKSGNLNVTKITEQGKKVRKNWTASWAVLQSSFLIFAKSQATASSWFGHQSKPEFSVDLRGGSVERACKDKTSKKNVLEVKTRQGTELLIQLDTESAINDWLKALTDAINTHAWESDEAIEEDMPESPGADKPDKDQQKKTKTKLKKFLTRRPTLQAVRDKGYIKDQVFGCNLNSLCQREKTTVPRFVKMCVDHVENHGLNLDGLYRVSGNLAVIQKLRFAVNHDEKINLADSKWEDVHVTTGALKMFFRELPEPLFSFALFNDFVSAIKISDYKQKVQAIKELVKQLPRPHHDTMQTLFKHLRKVIDHSEENRMTTQSVAIVFGPTLLRPEIETLNMAVHMVYQNQIVELILLEYEAVFGR